MEDLVDSHAHAHCGSENQLPLPPQIQTRSFRLQNVMASVTPGRWTRCFKIAEEHSEQKQIHQLAGDQIHIASGASN